MNIHTNIPLKNFTTMKIGGNARFMAEIRSADEIALIYQEAKKQSLPIFVIGSGSNLIAKDETYDGIVIKIRITGFEVINDDINSTTIKIGAGEIWDSIVEKSVNMHLSGIEAMSAIPGTIGAGPVQNMGAYGQEIADTLQSVDAYDSLENKFTTLTNAECNFSYRNSIFRSSAIGRYVITAVTLKLSKNLPQPPFYESLQKYFDEHNIKLYTQDIIRKSVIDIRSRKLPDPSIEPNSGSFFKNAIIEEWQINNLKAIDPNIPLHEMGNGTFKVPAGWLIESSGLKGQIFNGIRICPNNALVLINESANSYQDLLNAKNEIIGIVRNKYGIVLEQEPLEIK